VRLKLSGSGSYRLLQALSPIFSLLCAGTSVLGANGENCLSLFWAKEYYCTGIFSSSPTMTTAAVPTKTSSPSSSSAYRPIAPGPTQVCNFWISRECKTILTTCRLVLWQIATNLQLLRMVLAAGISQHRAG
jgi:hypothetical protein